MNKLKINENELIQKLDQWIGQNVDTISKAQEISKKIIDAKLSHINRTLPFEILPIDDLASDFKLIIYLDHPKTDTTELFIDKDGVFILDNENKKYFIDDQDLEDFITQSNDEINVFFQKFLEAIEKRNYTEVNKLINQELANYRSSVDPAIKEIKSFLTSIDKMGLTNPTDGSVSYLNRVVGRWDLALTWENCPFVVISDSDLTLEVKTKVNDFKTFEKLESGLLNSMQKVCLISSMDVQVITDSKDTEMDASGWLSLDKFGVPQIGPLLHVVKINVFSMFEGNVRKEAGTSSKLLIK
jgi:hypothetical protein